MCEKGKEAFFLSHFLVPFGGAGNHYHMTNNEQILMFQISTFKIDTSYEQDMTVFEFTQFWKKVYVSLNRVQSAARSSVPGLSQMMLRRSFPAQPLPLR